MGLFGKRPANDEPDLSGLGRNTLGCHITDCPCAHDPRHHYTEYLETPEQRQARIAYAVSSWTGDDEPRLGLGGPR